VPAVVAALFSYVLLALLVVGCRPADEIRTYRVSVPKQSAQPAGEMPVAGDPTHRMLAAIVPQDARAWFLKVVGPMAAMDEQEQAILEFFESVRTGDGPAPPRWELPEGWTEQTGSGMRAATITIPAEPEPLELSVIGLPSKGGPAEMLSNANRWRGQLQLPPVGADGLAECTRETSAEGTAMTIVDLRGRWQDTGMTAPFAGGMPPVISRPAPVANRPQSPQFAAPESWREMPAVPPRRAAYQIVDGPREALVTVIDFPAGAGAMIGDPLANLNRWRREVGLAEIAADELDEAVETIEVDGEPGSYFALLPDPDNEQESMADRATLAAMVTHDGRVWFFKLTGDRELVADQQAAFRSFLDSVQLRAEGAGDGN
jgi:hypothetical protein